MRKALQTLFLVLRDVLFILIAGGTLLAQIRLQELLPKEAGLGGWKTEGAAQIFKGDDLFIYIDGGAEIYFEYGFRQVLVQEYKDNQGRRVSLEIFEMTSPVSAYGIFSFKRSARGKAVGLGDEAQLADYYLNFWKGNLVVTVTGLNADEETGPELMSLAKGIEAKMPGRAEKPQLVALLPQEGLQTQSVKFFKGPLGLYNSYAFFRADIFSFETAVKGDYALGYTLYILEYPDGLSATQQFSKAKINFKQGEGYTDYAEAEGFLKVKDAKDKWIFGTSHGEYILLIVSGEDFAGVGKIFSLFKDKIKVT